jgi:hypothetical protein
MIEEKEFKGYGKVILSIRRVKICGLDSSGSGQGLGASSCGNGNEPSVSIMGGSLFIVE